MIKVKLQDAEGHGYWLYEDGQFVLALKDKPAVGIQCRVVAWLRNGVLSLRHLVWHRKNKCWYPARFPLMKTTSFGIQIVYVEAKDGEGNEYKGWVHPRVLTRRGDVYHSTGYERQVKLLPTDLKSTRKLAEKVWEELQ